MQAHELAVMIPEDHRLVVDLPSGVRSGPARLILLISGDNPPTEAERARPEARGRMAALHAELIQDPRSFRELSAAERQARLRRVKGVARGLLTTDESASEEFARQKRAEIEIEERKLGR
jgi:hypothetical protein